MISNKSITRLIDLTALSTTWHKNVEETLMKKVSAKLHHHQYIWIFCRNKTNQYLSTVSQQNSWVMFYFMKWKIHPIFYSIKCSNLAFSSKKSGNWGFKWWKRLGHFGIKIISLIKILITAKWLRCWYWTSWLHLI